MAAAASSSSAAAAADVADLPQPQVNEGRTHRDTKCATVPRCGSSLSSCWFILPVRQCLSGHGRPTRPQELLPFLISEVARSGANRGALIAQIASGPLTQQQLLLHHNKETIESTLLQRVKEKIDAQLAAKGIEGIITLFPDLTSLDLLLDLVYIIDNSGEWAAWEPIIRVAKHQGRGGVTLPIELSSADVEGVGSRAVFDGRCEALRQLSLIGRHIGVTLERRSNGEERLGRALLVIRPLQTLPADHPFRNGYDEANPVCEFLGDVYASVRDAVLDEMRHRGSPVAVQYVNPDNDAPRYNRLRHLTIQQPPIWGRHTISTGHRVGEGLFHRMIVLHGDQPGQTFETHITIIIGSNPTFADASLYTTERPVDGKKGAARFPQTVKAVREVMGPDAERVFRNWLDIALD
ncbi:unnamed protein product [Vitrella brassicaformis CCMP3155]|uniref:Uncharacterized protein n=1 Tax=Vitrella brassicaformis (strain CCMP3155) TaxID=1169540 RepID=A0A0G4H5M2_VITBC|nr:unnamed protein product [Vitrella brassicaformis CCMP3155]|eukprot:CEM38959.1 unnamed protein product [Vitrella brassicaformis CCMP3155]